jgi:[protein-PII] uridylyltransferase
MTGSRATGRGVTRVRGQNGDIALAHIAAFGARALDLLYVSDLLGAKISSPTRNAAIKRALIQMFAAGADAEARNAAAV